MTSHQNSIATQLLRTIFILYFGVTLSLTLVQIAGEYYDMKDQVHRELKSLQSMTEHGLSNSLWELNMHQLPLLLEGILESSIVEGVLIVDDIGNEFALGNTVKGVEASQENSQLFWHQFSLEFRNKRVGTATFFSSPSVVIKKVQVGVILIVISAIIKTLALWAIFIWIVRKILGRPLLQFTKAIGGIQMDTLPTTEIQIFKNRSNELNFLEHTFNTMLSNIFQKQQELDGLNHTLEQKVRERTLEVTQALEKLQHTQAQLVHSEKMAGLGTLVAGIAHEINNPINFVHSGTQSVEKKLCEFKGFLFDLLEGDDSEVAIHFEQHFDGLKKSLGKIDEGSGRIRRIVQDLRTFSRLDEAEQKTIDLVASLESTIRLVRAQYQENIDFICEFEEKPHVECFPAKVNQLFMSIIMNSCEAIQEKQKEKIEPTKGSITFRSSIKDEEIHISVKDTGMGMKEEVKKKIFDPFFTTKPVGAGTGLGLSIAHGIIQQHRGTIEVQSDEAQGSVFTIKLPLLME